MLVESCLHKTVKKDDLSDYVDDQHTIMVIQSYFLMTSRMPMLCNSMFYER